jgi:hypothetical protein
VQIQEGKIYQIYHTRKGNFKGRALATCEPDQEMIDFEIIEGEAKTIVRGNERGVGEKVTVSRKLARIEGPLGPAR